MVRWEKLSQRSGPEFAWDTWQRFTLCCSLRIFAWLCPRYASTCTCLRLLCMACSPQFRLSLGTLQIPTAAKHPICFCHATTCAIKRLHFTYSSRCIVVSLPHHFYELISWQNSLLSSCRRLLVRSHRATSRQAPHGSEGAVTS